VKKIRSSSDIETTQNLIKSNKSVPFHVSATWNRDIDALATTYMQSRLRASSEIYKEMQPLIRKLHGFQNS
jgi:hypothetical protein